MANRRLKRLQLVLSGMGRRTDSGDWLIPDAVLACAYPKTDAALDALRKQGISVLINLHERDHAPESLAARDLTSVHIPVVDFSVSWRARCRPLRRRARAHRDAARLLPRRPRCDRARGDSARAGGQAGVDRDG